MTKFNHVPVKLPELKTVLIVLGKFDNMFSVITTDDPLPIPSSVIISLNHITIIDPVAKANVI